MTFCAPRSPSSNCQIGRPVQVSKLRESSQMGPAQKKRRVVELVDKADQKQEKPPPHTCFLCLSLKALFPQGFHKSVGGSCFRQLKANWIRLDCLRLEAHINHWFGVFRACQKSKLWYRKWKLIWCFGPLAVSQAARPRPPWNCPSPALTRAP